MPTYTLLLGKSAIGLWLKEFLSKILRDGVDTPSAVMTTRAPAVLKV